MTVFQIKVYFRSPGFEADKDAYLLYRVETIDYETYLVFLESEYWYAPEAVFLEKVKGGWNVQELQLTVREAINRLDESHPKLAALITKGIEDWIRRNDAAFTE